MNVATSLVGGFVSTLMALSCSVGLPSGASYVGMIGFLVLSNMFLLIAGVLSHFFRRSDSLCLLQWAVAVLLLGVAPFQLDGYLESVYSLVGPGVGTLCRFIAGSMAFLGLFRIVEAIAGETPADAVRDLPSWLNYLTSVDSRRGPDVDREEVEHKHLT